MTEKTSLESLPSWPEPITGGKYVRMLEKHVRALRDADAHGNRQLFLDDVVIAHLLAFFNPTLRSLRTIEDFSQTRQAQRHLSVRRLCKSTLSDFHRIADPALLSPIVERLKAATVAKGLRPTPANLPETLGQVLAVDGSFFAVAADVAWAVAHRTNKGKTRASVRLDMHLDVATWLPQVVDVSGMKRARPNTPPYPSRPAPFTSMIAAFLASSCSNVNRKPRRFLCIGCESLGLAARNSSGKTRVRSRRKTKRPVC